MDKGFVFIQQNVYKRQNKIQQFQSIRLISVFNYRHRKSKSLFYSQRTKFVTFSNSAQCKNKASNYLNNKN
jgi:hypothetical protein